MSNKAFADKNIQFSPAELKNWSHLRIHAFCSLFIRTRARYQPKINLLKCYEILKFLGISATPNGSIWALYPSGAPEYRWGSRGLSGGSPWVIRGRGLQFLGISGIFLEMSQALARNG